MKHFFAIVGGMGTQATETYLHQLNLRTPAHKDQDYLNYLLVNHATVPDRTNYILDHTKPNPLPDLLEDLRHLSALKPDFFVMPCNTAHYFYDELQAAVSVPLLHMPRETVRYLRKNHPDAKRIGIIGTRGTIADHIVENEVVDAGLTPVLPTEEIEDEVMRVIYDDVKIRNVVNRDRYHATVRRMVEELHCDAVILGCTELSLAQDREPVNDHLVIDSQSILVDRTLELAVPQQKGYEYVPKK